MRFEASSLVFLLAVACVGVAGAQAEDPPIFLRTWGGRGSGDGQFQRPKALAVDAAGNVYVADTDNNRIQKFDGEGRFLMKWGEQGSGHGQFDHPGGIAVDANGAVYVSDTRNHRVQKFDAAGNFLIAWGSAGDLAGQFSNPHGIEVDPAGDNVYVVDSDNNRVQRFDSSGHYVTKWGEKGEEAWQWNNPWGLAVDFWGRIQTTDTGGGRIQVYFDDGYWAENWGYRGYWVREFEQPRGMTVDLNGNIYIADMWNERIQKFDRFTREQSVWGTRGSGDGQFNWPYDVAVDANGNTFVADSENHRIQKFAPPLALPETHWWDGFGSAQDRGFDDYVAALAMFRGELIAGGPFTAAGSVRLDRIARWDGQAWHPLGGGLDDLDCPGQSCLGQVYALTVYGGDLIVGGRFWTVDDGRVVAGYIARWDGSAWHELGGGLDDEVYALTVYDGKLVAGGRFTRAGEGAAERLAVWDGAEWSALGGGVTGVAGGSGTHVQGLTEHEGQLVVAGSFGQAGGVAASNIAAWDGSVWRPLGEGSREPSWAVTSHEGELYANFKQLEITGFIYGIARWDGSAWHPTGNPSGNYVAFANYQGRLVACGSDLLWLNGAEWSPWPGKGVDGGAVALAVQGTSLFIGGGFKMAGGKPSAGIARWDQVITAVEVQDFAAMATNGSITINWRLDSPSELSSIDVERSASAPGPYRTLVRLPPEPVMSYEDREVLRGGEYWYRLLMHAVDGEPVVSAALRVAGSTDLGTALLPPVPVGTGRRMQIRYRISEPGTPVVLGAFDVRGRLLRTLDRGTREPGEYAKLWDGLTEAGKNLPRGVYVIRLQAGPLVASRKVVVAGN